MISVHWANLEEKLANLNLDIGKKVWNLQSHCSIEAILLVSEPPFWITHLWNLKGPSHRTTSIVSNRKGFNFKDSTTKGSKTVFSSWNNFYQRSTRHIASRKTPTNRRENRNKENEKGRVKLCVTHFPRTTAEQRAKKSMWMFSK